MWPRVVLGVAEAAAVVAEDVAEEDEADMGMEKGVVVMEIATAVTAEEEEDMEMERGGEGTGTEREEEVSCF